MKLQRAVSMEFLGTLLLAVSIVGSGHMAAAITHDYGLQLLINAIATAIGLATVIKLGMKVSGAHFNPAVTLVMLTLKKTEPKVGAYYISSQILGAITGVIIANVIYKQPAVIQSLIIRNGPNLFLSEVLSTSVLLWIILRFPNREDLVAIYAPLWIFGGILFTSSTSFANPAITIGRSFTNSITGIAPSSSVLFIVAQLIGAALGLLIAKKITNPSLEKDE